MTFKIIIRDTIKLGKKLNYGVFPDRGVED
jgi:hypothetical protein